MSGTFLELFTSGDVFILSLCEIFKMRSHVGEDVLVVPGEGYHSLQVMSGMFMGWGLNPWD